MWVLARFLQSVVEKIYLIGRSSEWNVENVDESTSEILADELHGVPIETF